MSEMVKVVVDAMGGDNAPEEPVKAAVEAVKEKENIQVILTGVQDVIEAELRKYPDYPKDRIRVVHASQVIETAEPPVMAIQKKKDSSIVVGLNLVKKQEADAFVSSGSTGAVLVGGQVIVGRIKGIRRPPLAPLIPTAKGVSLLIDCGANVDARPDHLVQFAQMGSIYMEDVVGIKNPRVAIVNIGAEEEKGNALVKETFPLLKECPDINFIGGRYVLYYSMSKWGGVESCGIGVAIADKPAGPFQDLGILFRSSTIGVTNSIDPFYIHDQGKNYLFWGSFHGIFGIELSEDGLSLKEGAEKKQIAGTAFEATYIHKKGKYYYFFGSIGTCCEGVNSTYTTVVGRAENLWGPYTDKSGRLLLENYFEVFLHGNDVFAGTGHNSEIVTDDAGKDWIFYHAFDRRKPGGRVLMLDRVEWEKGWPSVRKEEPALEAEVPFIEMKTVKE
jgi:hypothetical protein